MAKKYPKGVVPPCPGNLQDYTLIDRSGHLYWRRNRGSVQPATLNTALQQRRDAMTALSPTIRHLRQELMHYMRPLPTGSLYNNLFKWLQQSWIDSGTINYSGMKGMELSDRYPLRKIFLGVYRSRIINGFLQLEIMPGSKALQQQNSLAREFALEAIFVKGKGEEINIMLERSPTYSIKEGINSECLFEFELPANDPWMLILRMVSFEDKQWAIHPRHYGMAVVETG